MGQHEAFGLARLDIELGQRPQVLASQFHLRAQGEPVRAADQLQRAVILPAGPGHDVAIFEPDHQLHRHPHPAATSDHQAHQGRVAVPWRHEVDDRDRALCGFDVGLQDQRALAVASRRAGDRGGRGDAPTAVLGTAEQGGEAGAGVEARPAQPVDRAVARDQRRGLAVADDGVILQRRRHPGPRRYTVATGVAGEPTAPGRRSGGAVSRKRLRPLARSQSASSVRYHISPR